ncbi:MAG: hypothetical protein JWN21_472 [Sphingomonas bacterium]|uniref:hypothetical protein n=1 Tax=Sphingomonas bacterium TaxID=1895847 RepID=UPI0026030289|nr:hypothetical protein [Sphingomonas bacterium]MDB5694929.1 hypothetical protein [Sphingomonas bacterium]
MTDQSRQPSNLLRLVRHIALSGTFHSPTERMRVPDNQSDDLRRIGTRLEWIYPADHDDDMATIIGPLFREPWVANGSSADPAEASEPQSQS